MKMPNNFKFKHAVSAIAIGLFLLGQVFLLVKVWNTNSERINLSYAKLGRDAITELSFSGRALDSVYSNFNKVAIKQILILNTIQPEQIDSIAYITLTQFNEQLLHHENITHAVAKKFKDNKLSDGCSAFFEIKQLQLLPNSEHAVNVVSADNYFEEQSSLVNIRIGQLINETSFYKTEIVFYIKFVNKEQLVFKEVFSLFLISMLCLLIVFVVYYASLKNMQRERVLSDMKTDFMNNLMHELRTPLATLSVAGKTLEMESVQNNPEIIASTAKTIKRQNIHLNSLVDHIVDISMWEKEQFTLDRTQCDLSEFLHNIVMAFNTNKDDNDSILEHYEQNLPKASIDVFHFTTVINNLISNSIKYCNGKALIKVSVEWNKGFLISISDNGIGIENDMQSFLFNKFYRVQQGNKHKVKGIGLGLYYVRKITEAHGGEIKVKSKVGEGSTFTIFLNET